MRNEKLAWRLAKVSQWGPVQKRSLPSNVLDYLIYRNVCENRETKAYHTTHYRILFNAAYFNINHSK